MILHFCVALTLVGDVQRIRFSETKVHALARDCTVCAPREQECKHSPGLHHMRFLRTKAHTLASYN
jgi:hypothetical protein